MAITEGTVLKAVQTINMPGNEIAQNVYHFVISGGSAPYDNEDVVSDIKDFLDDLYTEHLDLFPSDVSGGLVQVYEYDPVDEDWDEVGFDEATWVGTSSGEGLPHGVAPIFSGLTTDPDVRGRKFWPGLTENHQNDSALLSTPLGYLADIAALYVTAQTGAITGALIGPGVWSPTRENFYLFAGSAIVNAILGYQRRRKPGVGA